MANCAQCVLECIYDPNSDHRRKGVYKNDIDNLKTRNTTLQTIIQALLNDEEQKAFDLVREIRTCDSLDAVAEKITAGQRGVDYEDEEDYDASPDANGDSQVPTFEKQLYGKMGDLRLDEGSVRYIGGTSNLIHISLDDGDDEADEYPQHDVRTSTYTAVITADGCRTPLLLGRESLTTLSLSSTYLICTLHGIILSSPLCRRACSGETSGLENRHQTLREKRITALLCWSMLCWPLVVTSRPTVEHERTRMIPELQAITSSERRRD
jgi:hypothetical protein